MARYFLIISFVNLHVPHVHVHVHAYAAPARRVSTILTMFKDIGVSAVVRIVVGPAIRVLQHVDVALREVKFSITCKDRGH